MKRGVTLIELTMAIVIGGLIFSAAASLLLAVLTNTVEPEYLLTVSTLGRQKIEEITNTPYDSVASAGPASFPGSFSQYQYAVNAVYVGPDNLNAVSASDTGYKKVTITVGKPGLRGYNFVTLVAGRQ